MFFHSSLAHRLLMGCAVAFSFGLQSSDCSAKDPPAAKGTPIPPSPEFTDPPILPTKPDAKSAKPKAFRKKLLDTNPLLRPPFAAAPVDSLKGMASGIKAVELDAPNRILAAQFLGTVDCATYPQAQEMLIQTMQEDPIEEVRYEAVLALRLMLTRGCCNLDTGCRCESCVARLQIAEETTKHAEKAKKNHEKPKLLNPDLLDRKRFKLLKTVPQERRFDCCRGCCNAKVMNALAKVAYEADEFGCCLEPSERVRDAAAMGLCLCQCYPAPMDHGTPPSAPPARETEEIDQTKPKEETSPTPGEKSTKVMRPIRQVSSVKPANGQPKTIQGLNGYCIVGLKSRQFVPAKQEFWSVYEERTYFSAEARTYFFASAEARDEFDWDPTAYVPAYGGFDPVEFIESRSKIEGKFLREHDGRFFLFSTKENWEMFKANPARYQVPEGQ